MGTKPVDSPNFPDDNNKGDCYHENCRQYGVCERMKLHHHREVLILDMNRHDMELSMKKKKQLVSV